MAGWNFATPDWADRIDRGEFPVDMARLRPMLNQKRVEAAREIFGNLRLADVPGQPTHNEASGPWVFDLLDLIAGSITPDGVAQCDNAVLMIPKKNGKSAIGAHLLLTLCLMSPRPQSTYLFIAPSQNISSLAFDSVRGAILCDPYLTERLTIKDHIKTILDTESGSTLVIKSLSMEAITGVRINGAVMIDEAHLMTREVASRVLGQIKGGMVSSPTAQLIMTTTAADVRPTGFWKDELAKIRAVRDGERELPGYLPITYELRPEVQADLSQAKDIANIVKVNPNAGRSVSVEWLERSVKEAEDVGEPELRRWLSQHANLEVGTFGAVNDAWPGAALWTPAADPDRFESLEDMLEAATQVALGLDGGGLEDIMSLCVLARLPDDVLFAWSINTLHQQAIERRPRMGPAMAEFAQAGDLEIITEYGADMKLIVDVIAEIYNFDPSKFVGCGVDPAGIGAEIANALVQAGFSRNLLISVPQGWRLSPAFLSIQRRLSEGRLRHAGQPIMEYAVNNATLDAKGRVVRSDDVSRKVDPLWALADAMAVMNEAPEPLGDVASWVFFG